jgi:iron complex transport system substrate-binding protein
MRTQVIAMAAAALLAAAAFPRADGGDAAAYKRIIALTPSSVEIIYALGAEDRLVGISSFSDYPPRARAEKPAVGGVVNLDVEKIISLSSDLVLSDPSVMASEKLAALGVKAEFIPNDTLADVENSFTRIGELVGKAAAGKALANRLAKAVESARKASAGRPRPRVLAVIGYEPLWVAGGYGFLNELIAAAGGDNAAGAVKKDFYAADFERILVARPEVILDLTLEAPPTAAEREKALAFWRRAGSIPAVSNGRVEFVESDLLTIPGPRLIDGLGRIQRALGIVPKEPPAAAPAGGAARAK